jgi:hypothetical protein
MPERVTTRWVGSPSAESTRFPGEGQSAQGQSGPKARPKGVADGQTVNIPSPVCKGEPTGDAGTTWIGVIDAPVPQGRQHWIWKSKDPPATKSQSGTTTRPVPQSDTGVPGENPKAFGRTLVKELGKMTPYPRYKGCSLARGSRRESALATVYQKHRTLPTRKRTYRV